jgi:hypothetical protein
LSSHFFDDSNARQPSLDLCVSLSTSEKRQTKEPERLCGTLSLGNTSDVVAWRHRKPVAPLEYRDEITHRHNFTAYIPAYKYYPSTPSAWTAHTMSLSFVLHESNPQRLPSNMVCSPRGPVPPRHCLPCQVEPYLHFTGSKRGHRRQESVGGRDIVEVQTARIPPSALTYRGNAPSP